MKPPPPLRSRILRGHVFHERMGPVRHAFTYPMTFFAFELSELKEIAAQTTLFSYNDTGWISIRDENFLDTSNETLTQKVDRLLGPPSSEGERTLIITSPKYLGYAFNPVNFHLRMRGAELISAVAEVNNTFGDRHVYPLLDLDQGTEANTWFAQCPKNFHVSPFNNMEGNYHFTFRLTPDSIFLGVDLHKGGTRVMKTWIQGRTTPLTDSAIAKYALLHPFDTALNSFPRILWQAAILYYKRKLPVFKRPTPSSEHTLIDRDTESHRRQIV